MPRNLSDLPWAALLKHNGYHPSPRDWSDQVFYFFLIDRFSDGNEELPGGSPMYSAGDNGNAIGTEADAAGWRAAGAVWQGGTLQGARSKIGYLQRLGVTALWVSPVLRQRPGVNDYHGYGAQNFLEVDPHFGTDADLKALVADAHNAGIYVILDVVLNHAGDVFDYDAANPRWTGSPIKVAGWRDKDGNPNLPFPNKVNDLDAAVWPSELQADGIFTCKGPIGDWDHDADQYTNGDFYGYKDIHHGSGPIDQYQHSAALEALAEAYQYWLVYADLDGFRIDTVKHMDPGATRYFSSVIHEFAQSIGKDSFFLVGEIPFDRAQAINLVDTTGLDAALGLDHLQDRLEFSVKGWIDPDQYFSLFSNSIQVEKESHAWFRAHVVTSYGDHDHAQRWNGKRRFAADPEGLALELAALALNATTLGIPCVYYGSEQCFDGSGDNDRYIRETMFGGSFGPFRSKGRHCFNPETPTYKALSQILAIRRQDIALRRGRQFLRPISEDGSSFWYPRRIGAGRMTSIVAWGRIMSNREVVCAINTDTDRSRSAWVTIDAGLHAAGDKYRYVYSTDAAKVGIPTAAEARNGLAIHIEVPPSGFVILAP